MTKHKRGVIVSLLGVSSLFGQSTDQGFSPANCNLVNGIPTSTPCSIPYSDPTLPLPTLRYGYGGAPLTYTLPFTNGPALVTLGFSEPNKTAAGQRLFTYKVNNGVPTQIDIFRMSGGQKKQLDVVIPTIVVNGNITIVFTAQVGNALVNSIRVDQIITTLVLTKWLQHPSGLQYVEINRSNGTVSKFWAAAPDTNFVLDASWTPVAP